MRNLLLILCVLGLCGCRVELLQLFGATIDSDEGRAARGLPPRELEEEFSDENFDVPSVGEYRLALNEEVIPDCTSAQPGKECLSPDGTCPEGFSLVSEKENTCREIDECLEGNGGCDTRATCTNTVGSRECGACPDGLEGTGDTECLDVNECLTESGLCTEDEVCINTFGGFYCASY